MEKLKFEDVKNLSWFEVMQKYEPEITKEKADFVLWEMTSYPMGNADNILKQIHNYFIK